MVYTVHQFMVIDNYDSTEDTDPSCFLTESIEINEKAEEENIEEESIQIEIVSADWILIIKIINFYFHQKLMKFFLIFQKINIS